MVSLAYIKDIKTNSFKLLRCTRRGLVDKSRQQVPNAVATIFPLDAYDIESDLNFIQFRVNVDPQFCQ